MNTLTKLAASLEHQDLLSLINGEILALRIHPFASTELCQKWHEDLTKHGQLSRYSNALDVPVNRIGMTLFETENKSEKIAKYLDESPNTINSLEKIFGPNHPLDQILTNLNKSWLQGCVVQKLNNKPMNPGIIRSFEASSNGGLPPHVDSLLKDLPDSKEFDNIKCQLAANLYFNLADSGGELKVWNFEPNHQELDQLYTGSYDFIDTEKIPVQENKLKPSCGELIIFRSSCVHAVSRSYGGMRSAASCFIGFYGENSPLTVWA